eukprot:gene11214-3268_t
MNVKPWFWLLQSISSVYVTLFLILLSATIPSTLCNHDYAQAIRDTMQNYQLSLIASSGVEFAENKPRSLVQGSSSNPLMISDSTFNELYTQNLAIWGDCTVKDAFINYFRAHTGNVDSARMLLEFSMVPSVQTTIGSPIHQAAMTGDVAALAFLNDVESASSIVDTTKADGTTPLLIATLMNKTKAVQLLIEQGADPNKAAMNGATPLHIASAMGHLTILHMLLDFGANINSRHSYAGSTPLHFACEMGQAKVITSLCLRGADANAQTTQGSRPLHVAVDMNQTASVQALIESCHVDVNSLLLGDTTPLYLAAQKGFTEIIKVLSENRANIDFEMPSGMKQTVIQPTSSMYQLSTNNEAEIFHWARQFNQLGSDPSAPGYEFGNGATALHVAVENGHVDAVYTLLKHGAKQKSSMRGATPLWVAAEYNRPEITQLLINFGGDPNVQMPHSGGTPLLRAIISDHMDVVQVLLKNHASTTIQTSDGLTPLHHACIKGNARAVEILINYNVQIFEPTKEGLVCAHLCAKYGHNALLNKILQLSRDNLSVRDNSGFTPLHHAALSGHAPVVQSLLLKGSSIAEKTTAFGLDPLMLASGRGHVAVINILLNSGADVHARANIMAYKAFPLYFAAQSKSFETVKRLLDAGASVNQRLSTGATTLFVVAESGLLDLLQLLLEKSAETNFVDIHGNTALLLAVKHEHSSIVESLLIHGVVNICKQPVSDSVKQDITRITSATRRSIVFR